MGYWLVELIEDYKKIEYSVLKIIAPGPSSKEGSRTFELVF